MDTRTSNLSVQAVAPTQVQHCSGNLWISIGIVGVTGAATALLTLWRHSGMICQNAELNSAEKTKRNLRVAFEGALIGILISIFVLLAYHYLVCTKMCHASTMLSTGTYAQPVPVMANPAQRYVAVKQQLSTTA